MLYDEYHDEYYDNTQVQNLFSDYLTWCENNNQTPEIKHISEIDEANIGHIAYHANLIK